jgi:hypothetical protein
MYIQDFYKPYLPSPSDPNARLSLALYRAGLSLNDPAYQCLSFFRIMNIFAASGPRQKAWISSALPLLKDGQATSRISEIATAHGDVADHLYHSNRCAVAHAGQGVTADPDDPTDIRRLVADLPLVQALAEYAVETEFKVKSSMTVFREHLYELAGFGPLFGEERLDKLRSAGTLDAADWPTLPPLTFGLAMKQPYPGMQELRAEITQVAAGVVLVRCTPNDKSSLVEVELDFPRERMRLNRPGIAARSGAAGLESIKQFCHDYDSNGILEVRGAESGELLGRCDAYLPTIHFNELK